MTKMLHQQPAPTQDLVVGELTLLRPATLGFSEGELRRRYRWSCDEALQYWSGTIPGGRDFDHFRQHLAQRDSPHDGRRVSYAILTKEQELVGMVSVYNLDFTRRTGEIGIYIGEKHLWGQGYGTDALITFLRHLFNSMQLDSVYLHTYESNVRAQRSYRTVGFVDDEIRRRYGPRIGYHRELKMSISRQRFVELHHQQPAGVS